MVPVLFISFVVCLAVGVPVAFSLGIASCLYFIGAGMPVSTFAQKFFAGMDSFTLLCIPGFTFAGNLMNQGGISDKLLDSRIPASAICAAVLPTRTSLHPWSSRVFPEPLWRIRSPWAALRSP